VARKYARDNRGRFASKGAGATARGGRLKTAGGNSRNAQTMKAAGGPAGTIGKPRGLKPTAGKASTGKWVPTTNSKGQVVGMRDSSKPAPSKAAVSQAARSQRANRNLNAAMKREGDGPNSKASRSASVAKRAGEIYRGKVDPKVKTKARLTKSTDSEALRKRVKKIKDNTTAKPAAKRRGPIGQISEAKAGRIVARIDANRPGLRRAQGSTRKTTNAIRTQQKAVDFALASGARARKKGQNLSVNQSLQRAVANAAKKRKR